MKLLVPLLALTVLSSAAFAEQFSVTSNVGGPIPASGTGGAAAAWPASLPLFAAESSITLPHEVSYVTSVIVRDLAHTAAGDLHAALRDPNGSYHNLFVRSGFDGTNANQGDFIGGSVNLITGAPTPFPGGLSTNIGSGTFTQDFGTSGAPPQPWPNGSQSVFNTPLNSVFGVAGTWTLVIWDWKAGDVGSFSGWTLNAVRPSIESACLGDGTQSTPCPCGNSGASGHGCNNSSNTGGALLTASGGFTPDTIVLTSSGERPTSLTIFVQGGVGGALPFGDGVGCLAGSLQRLYTTSAVGGVAVAPGPGDPSISQRSANLGAPLPHGIFRMYQAYYRDVSPTFCPSATFNVSNGLIITWP